MSIVVSDDENGSSVQLREELLRDDIASRLKLLIYSQTPEKRRFPTLQKLTDIKEATWRTWWSRGGIPSGALIEGVAKAWPEYAFWLVTGLTDADFGHRMPKPPVAGLGYVNNWPEGAYTSSPSFGWLDGQESHCPHLMLASEYFKICRQLKEAYKLHSGYGNESVNVLEHSRKYVIGKRREMYTRPSAKDEENLS